VGEKIPVSGVYRVFHSQHRVSHEVTLLAEEIFPRCSQCQSRVQFELIAEAPVAQSDNDFRIRLFEIPHPQEANKNNKNKMDGKK
jgi:hypothetical protein